MIRSMTAFAREELKQDFGTLICELRSVNHRYLEIYLRLPEELRPQEGRLREIAHGALGRGKLECQFSYRPASAIASQVVVNEALATAVVTATHRIEAMMNNAARVNALEVLAWPGVSSEPERDTGPVLSAAIGLFEATLEDLIATRAREGARLSGLIEQRLGGVERIVVRMRERRPQVLTALREKLLTRLRELDVEPDTGRLEQELVFVAQKLDVDEELDRLASHCKEVRGVLRRDEPVGRRLDFLLQEFNREANTLASKSADVETTQAAVDLKVLTEQMREQVQNIE
jgi:uncharacterized protein (TIGR00255 family)